MSLNRQNTVTELIYLVFLWLFSFDVYAALGIHSSWILDSGKFMYPALWGQGLTLQRCVVNLEKRNSNDDASVAKLTRRKLKTKNSFW